MSERDGRGDHHARVFGTIPYGRHHESMFGRLFYVYGRFFKGAAFATVVFAVVWMILTMHGMRGSIYQEDKRTLEFVRERLGDSDE